ncbi:MAG: HEPN domain-containing protein [Nitrospirae bacterium]|nr:HEPN domain-containing protein [Nitrospirota bacterium]
MNREQINTDKRNIKLAEEWFAQAGYDFKTAEAMFNARRYIYTVFMCHLSIEKALKGLLTQRLNNTPPKVHNLIYLIERTGITPPENLMEFVIQLNKVSVPTRYPEELKVLIKDYSRQRTNDILKSTGRLLRWLKKELKKR